MVPILGSSFCLEALGPTHSKNNHKLEDVWEGDSLFWYHRTSPLEKASLVSLLWEHGCKFRQCNLKQTVISLLKILLANGVKLVQALFVPYIEHMQCWLLQHHFGNERQHQNNPCSDLGPEILCKPWKWKFQCWCNITSQKFHKMLVHAKRPSLPWLFQQPTMKFGDKSRSWQRHDCWIKYHRSTYIPMFTSLSFRSPAAN